MKPRKVHAIIEIESSSTLNKLRSHPFYAILVHQGNYYKVNILKFYLPKEKKVKPHG